MPINQVLPSDDYQVSVKQDFTVLLWIMNSLPAQYKSKAEWCGPGRGVPETDATHGGSVYLKELFVP